MADPEPERRYIDPRQIEPGPIRHETLPDEVLAMAEEVFQIIGPYIGQTLEKFEIDLMRDANPECEVTIWCAIAYAWQDYHEKYLNSERQSDDDEKALVSALLLISMGEFPRKQVPEEVGRRLIECYDSILNQE